MSIRKKLICLSIIVLGMTNTIFAQDMPFVFDKNKIDIGTMYIYEYSTNNEGFEPNYKAYLYIKTLTDIELIWVAITSTKATTLEKYTINWNYMMLERMEYLSLKDKDKIVVNETFKGITVVDYSKEIMRSNWTDRREDGFKDINLIYKFSRIPTYFYRLTDLLELWFVLRFFPDNKKEISVNHNTEGYNTDLIIKYMGKEEVNVPYGKVLCNKFELLPKVNLFMRILTKPKNAYIWLASEDDTRYMVKYRNDNLRSTFIRSMEYRLAEVNKITQQEWENIKEKGVTK